MARPFEEFPGRWAVDVISPSGRRERLRLGRCGSRGAEEAASRVARVLACRRAGVTFDASDRAWAMAAPGPVRTRLERWGIVGPGGRSLVRATVAELLAAFLAGYRRHRKPRTVQLYNKAAADLGAFFGPGRAVGTLAAADAEAYRTHLVERRGLAAATVNLHVRHLKPLWRWGVEHAGLLVNIWKGIESASISGRKQFIAMADRVRVVAACDSPTRLHVALAGFAGCRVPSESGGLRWQDVDWGRRRFTVYAPKTKRSREVPMTPELLRILTAERARLGGAPVGLIATEAPNNLYRAVARACKRAGVKRWPRLFDALRESVASEWSEAWGVAAAAAWCGHSATVALGSYQGATPGAWAGVTGYGRAQQNAQQIGPETVGNGREARTLVVGQNPGISQGTRANVEWPRRDSNPGPSDYESPALDR